MSRDLKQEYEAMLDQEIPDLWSRIEPRLAEKGSLSQETERTAVQQTVGMDAGRREGINIETGWQEGVNMSAGRRENIRSDAWQQENTELGAGKQGTQLKEMKARKRRIRRSTIAVWGSLAAACVCLAVILPAWRGNKKGYDETNQISSADYNVMDSEAVNDKAADGAAASENGQQTEDGMMNGMEPESAVDCAGEEAGTQGDAEAEDFQISEDYLSQTDSAGEDAANAENSAAAPEEEPEESVQEAGALQQYECYGEIVDAWQTIEGFFYQMKLIEGTVESAPDEDEMIIWQKDGFLSGMLGASKERLLTGERYTVVVEPETVNGETRYVLVSYEPDEQ